jgi:hypothetical protein
MDALPTDFHELELTELAARIKARAISPVAVTRALLNRISSADCTLHSYALVMADVAMAQAEAAEAELAAGRYRAPLHGVPIAVKDLCWTKGYPTAAGMAIHKHYRPHDDAIVVRRLKDAGSVLLGKLQLTEGAYSDHHPSVTPPRNPWGCRLLARHFLQRSRRRDGSRPVLRRGRLRYRWVDSLAVRRQRRNRAQADLGPRQPLWCVRAGGDAGSCRADGAQRAGCRRDTCGHRRQ